MDDYTLQAALEATAGNATSAEPADNGPLTSEPISATMARWQRLFHLSPDVAVDRIMDHRQDLTRLRVSDDHWETIRGAKEAEGHDRESYEYGLELQRRRALLPSPAALGRDGGSGAITYLVELDGPLSNPEAVQSAASLEQVPLEVAGHSVEEGRGVRLCCVDGRGKAALLRWAAEQGGGYEPTILVDPRSLR
ncbi:hypothetical protein LTR53_012002 [Teratosphaeriaceae sp. CCFEE 6253]|nr:hypothetical protein LTR53_012002 [Teratosphaeriaceae sp. CCFEE 6253]